MAADSTRRLRPVLGGNASRAVDETTISHLATSIACHNYCKSSRPAATIRPLYPRPTAAKHDRHSGVGASPLDDLSRSDSYERWAPVIVTKCMHGMDGRSAPCIKEADRTNLVEAQELLYPAFRLKLPTFSNAQMKAKWLSQGLHVERMRVSEDQLWAEYPPFQGQNMVFSHALYRGDPPPDIWSENGCMGHNVSHLSFVHDLKANASHLANGSSVDTLVVATSPDSWSFQHFIDRVAVVWSQAQLVIPTTTKNGTAIVTGREPRDAIVNEIYDVMVGQHLHDPQSVFAKRLVFSCRAPLIHPFTTQRITENILQLLPPAPSESNRNVICSSHGRTAARRLTGEGKF
ncbi:hypothetical protein V7S43_015397 [Phytophthora oleae]|uniref:Uncharacterized protein n=1 Tax=Phytophthora oleae TaxID=2107226 RepID=A0ABD3EZ44_9STRA